MGSNGSCMALEKGGCAIDASGLNFSGLGFDEDVVHASHSMDVVPSLQMKGTVSDDNPTLSSRRPLLYEQKVLVDDLPLLDCDELGDAVVRLELRKAEPGQRIGIRTLPCRGSHSISFIYKGSLVELHNLANPDNEVRIGDHIVEVNGVKYDHLKIKQEWTTKPNLSIKLISAKVLDVKISKKANEMLGIKTRAGVKAHQITSISAGGLIDQWNAANLGQNMALNGKALISVGDYIVETNGVLGDAELVRNEWMTRDKIVMKVMVPHHRNSTLNVEAVGAGDQTEIDG